MTTPGVFIRGVGAVTALGPTWATSLAPLAAGASAVRPTDFDTAGFPCTVAAPIAGFDDADDRRLALVRAAAREAWATAGGPQPDRRLGIFIGAESGRASFATIHALTRAAGGGDRFDHARFGTGARALAAQFDAARMSPASVASALAQDYGATGPVTTLSLACSSGAAAIAEAARALRLGLCDVALCGGVGADIDPLMLCGFGRIGALSARGMSCPFDVRRDGFVVGEGAAMLVLSTARGEARVELAGEGRSLDAHNLTAPDPDGAGASRAMRTAMRMAGAVRVDVIQAHGTSTPLNDAVEAKALHRVLGTGIDTARVSSIKGALGHWIAGAGALGALAAHEALDSGAVLPTANLQTPDPHCALPHVIGTAATVHAETALVNSFAFGGANCSLVLRRVA